ncbi:MAG: hypothetical protein OEY00_08270 [Gammaproteobacteria bacterium]|nr:hypothetical protein [Gammaproteobacteria bacterium]
MLNRKHIPIYFLFLLLIIPTVSNSTGPSYADIKIIPVAMNEKGVLLFKTYSHINKVGRHSLEGVEYGWLLVSAQGVWEEKIYYRVTEEDSDDSRKIDFLEKKFNQKLNLKKPPESVRELMNRFASGKWAPLKPNKGKEEINWYPDKICIKERCSKRYIPQKTLSGLTNHTGTGTHISSTFFHKGIAVFNNSNHWESEKPTGADFQIRNIIDGKDVGVDMVNIAGISIVEIINDNP